MRLMEFEHSKLRCNSLKFDVFTHENMYPYFSFRSVECGRVFNLQFSLSRVKSLSLFCGQDT